jgi:poly-beta-1,6-N-acetyl-D-glucosamine synthase
MQLNHTKSLKYVLITPARDEATHIRKTLDSVVTQTILPLKWVIVSDGSIDGTDEIVRGYAANYDWIELLRMPERKERHFGGKVRAFNSGYAQVGNLNYDIIGNLDGDISFEPDYIEYLLGELAGNPRLGVVGTNYWEHSWESSLKHDYRFASVEDVSGACQLFRRKCFENIGGYKPSKAGGVDLIATVSARMHGWETRTCTGKFAIHHRQQGTASAHRLMVEYNNGRRDYIFGGHPLWEVCRAIYRLAKKPLILGGCLLFIGYFWAMLRGTEKIVSTEILEFRRNEQMNRLARILRRLFAPRVGMRDAAGP